MKLVIQTRPCLLLETAEIVFSFVNDLPPGQLTVPGEWCIPEEEALRIRNEVCRGLEPRDKKLQFFFQGFELEGGYNRLSNLGTMMLYSCLNALPPDVEQMKENMLAFWESIEPPYCISAADPFALSIVHGSPDEFSPLSEEMNKVPAPMSYQLRLTEVFSQYPRYLHQLVDILHPLAKRLEPLLEPWIRQAQPLLQKWEAFFSEPENVRDFFRNRMAGFQCDQIEICLRYFPSKGGYYRLINEEKDSQGMACLLIGLDMKPGVSKAASAPSLDEEEVAALRLIANPDRLEMLSAMMRRPMGGHELAGELGLNSGTVFRDLNNLATAKLITRVAEGRKRVYSTNMETLRNLTRRILQVVNPDEPD